MLSKLKFEAQTIVGIILKKKSYFYYLNEEKLIDTVNQPENEKPLIFRRFKNSKKLGRHPIATLRNFSGTTSNSSPSLPLTESLAAL
jgi:hypothetical protein